MFHQNSHNYTKNLDKNLDKTTRGIIFTDVSIRHLKPEAKKREYYCSNLLGFGIRVLPSGTKTWFYCYLSGSSQRKMSLGKYPKVSLGEALHLYRQAKEKLENGIDPLEEKQKKLISRQKEPTVSELIEIYVQHGIKLGKANINVEYKCFQKDIIPTIGKRKIKEVTPKELAKIFHTVIVERDAPIMASRLFSYVRRLFNFASDMGLMRRRDNPCLDINLKIKENKKTRHLSSQEIHKFWYHINDIPTTGVLKLALKFMLTTLARGVEVRTMKWCDVNLKDRVWTLPKTKNGHIHRIYLSDLSLEILKKVRNYSNGEGLVFGSTGKFKNRHTVFDDLKPMHNRTLCQPIKRHFEKFDIQEPFTPHDLRRTGATIIASLFGRKDLVKICLNHVSNDVTDIYDQYTYSQEKKIAMNALNKALRIILESKNIESIPSEDNLRELVFKNDQQKTIPLKKAQKPVGFQASFSSPVSYRLSFDRETLSNVV